MRKRIDWIVFLFLLICGPSFALSAEKLPNTVRTLIVLGIEENLGLKIERLNLPISGQEEIVQDSAFDTEFFASSSFAKTETPNASTLSLQETVDSDQLSGQIGLRKRFTSGLNGEINLSSARLSDNSGTASLDPSYRTSLLLDLSQPLLRDAGPQVNTTGIQLAKNRTRQSQLNYLLQAQTLALGIADLAYQLSAAERVVGLRQDAVTLAEQTYRGNQKRFSVGVIPVSEVQQAETALADRELKLSLARQTYKELVIALKRLLNQQPSPDPDKLEIPGIESVNPANLPDLDDLFAQAKKKRLDLQIAAVDQQNAAVEKDYYRNQLEPKLDLRLQAGLVGLSGSAINTSTTSRYEGTWLESGGSLLAGEGTQWLAGIQFSLPLGNRLGDAQFQQAQLKERQSHYAQRDLQEQLKSEISQQLSNLQHSYEQLQIAEKFESLAVLSLHQEQRRLEEELSDTFRILSFQDQMIDAKIVRIDAATQCRRNFSRFQYVRGELLETFKISVKIDPMGI